MLSEVVLLRTSRFPSLETVYNNLNRCMEMLGGIDHFVPKGSKVLLKPNIGSVARPEEARNTDPKIIEGIIILLREDGIGEITIAESSIVGSDTSAAFEEMGLDKISKRHNVRLVDLKKEPFIKKIVPESLVLPYIKLSAIVDEIDIFINLPKLKTIFAVPISLGLKNLKGLLPDVEKKRFHHTMLAKAIIDLNKVVKTNLTIIDGLVSSELYEPKETNCLIAGSDVLAVDAVTTRAIGLNPAEIEYLRLAEEAGIGILDLKKINVLGEPLSEIRLDLKLAPDRSEAFSNLFPEVEIIDGEACSGCVASLYLSLKMVRSKGIMDKITGFKIVLGLGVEKIPSDEKVLCIGNCAKKLQGRYFLPGCPFTYMDFSDYLEKYLS